MEIFAEPSTPTNISQVQKSRSEKESNNDTPHCDDERCREIIPPFRQDGSVEEGCQIEPRFPGVMLRPRASVVPAADFGRLCPCVIVPLWMRRGKALIESLGRAPDNSTRTLYLRQVCYYHGKWFVWKIMHESIPGVGPYVRT